MIRSATDLLRHVPPQTHFPSHYQYVEGLPGIIFPFQSNLLIIKSGRRQGRVDRAPREYPWLPLPFEGVSHFTH
jgi:hypothetical protein